MKFETKSFIKRTCGGDDANGGVQTPTSTFWKAIPRVLTDKDLTEVTKGTNHQLQAPFAEHPWNEMKVNWLYESICVGFWRFPWGSQVPNGLSPRELWEPSRNL